MLSLLVMAASIPRTSENVQPEGLNPAFRCRLYHMGMALAEVPAVLSMFEVRPVCIQNLDRFVHLDHRYQHYRIRCIL